MRSIAFSLSEPFRQRHADRVWSMAIRMRNILVHHYFEIDQALVWKVAENDLPRLRATVERILTELA